MATQPLLSFPLPPPVCQLLQPQCSRVTAAAAAACRRDAAHCRSTFSILNPIVSPSCESALGAHIKSFAPRMRRELNLLFLQMRRAHERKNPISSVRTFDVVGSRGHIGLCAQKVCPCSRLRGATKLSVCKRGLGSLAVCSGRVRGGGDRRAGDRLNFAAPSGAIGKRAKLLLTMLVRGRLVNTRFLDRYRCVGRPATETIVAKTRRSRQSCWRRRNNKPHVGKRARTHSRNRQAIKSESPTVVNLCLAMFVRLRENCRMSSVDRRPERMARGAGGGWILLVYTERYAKSRTHTYKYVEESRCT